MQIGMGCVNVGSASGVSTTAGDVRLVQEAIDLGVAVFDTADVYGGGASERILGRAVRGRRADVVIATKAGYVFRERSGLERRLRAVAAPVARRVRRAGGEAGQRAPGGTSYASQDFSPSSLRAAIDASLRRLDTDYLDVVQLHGPHERLPDLLASLSDVVTSGKVRRLGVGAESIADAEQWSTVTGLDVLQVPFGVLDPGAAGVLAAVAERGVEGWARGVLGGGLLAAAMAGDPDVRGDPKWPVIADLQRVAKEAGTDLVRLAMGYVRANAAVHTVLVGTSSPEHLRRNVGLFESAQLDAETSAAVAATLDRHAALLEAS